MLNIPLKRVPKIWLPLHGHPQSMQFQEKRCSILLEMVGTSSKNCNHFWTTRSFSGWSLDKAIWKIWVNWDDFSQYMEKKHIPNHQPVLCMFWIFSVEALQTHCEKLTNGGPGNETTYARGKNMKGTLGYTHLIPTQQIQNSMPSGLQGSHAGKAPQRRMQARVYRLIVLFLTLFHHIPTMTGWCYT